MTIDPRTRGLSETCAERGPSRPLHTKGGPPATSRNLSPRRQNLLKELPPTDRNPQSILDPEDRCANGVH